MGTNKKKQPKTAESRVAIRDVWLVFCRADNTWLRGDVGWDPALDRAGQFLTKASAVAQIEKIDPKGLLGLDVLQLHATYGDGRPFGLHGAKLSKQRATQLRWIEKSLEGSGRTTLPLAENLAQEFEHSTLYAQRTINLFQDANHLVRDSMGLWRVCWDPKEGERVSGPTNRYRGPGRAKRRGRHDRRKAILCVMGYSMISARNILDSLKRINVETSRSTLAADMQALAHDGWVTHNGRPCKSFWRRSAKRLNDSTDLGFLKMDEKRNAVMRKKRKSC